MNMLQVIKKDLTKQPFDTGKIKNAITKSAYRVLHPLTNDELERVANIVRERAEEYGKDTGEISVAIMHNLAEMVLDELYPEVAKSYRDYRNYKTSFVEILDDVYRKSQKIMYIGDKENSNTDSALVSTKRSLIFNKLNKELYKKFFLTTETLQACNDGYIYIHDMTSRRDTMNCCIFDVERVLHGGFEMGNIWYNEPKSLDTAFDVIGDIVLSAASQQYGGFTIPRLDEILDEYAQKSYHKYFQEMLCDYATITYGNDLSEEEMDDALKNIDEIIKSKIDVRAYAKVERDMMQGFQGFEYKFNTVASSRGDYPFITITVGVGTSRFAKLATTCCLRVRKKGQGKPGFEKQVLFPKIVFTYTEDLHGVGKFNEDLFEEGILCSAKGMYPDWLSLDGPTTVSEMWHKYGEVIAPMGCRAFLSPWYEKGGIHPADENDRPVFTGRFNIGAVSLHLPMILAKARQENKDFYEVLDYYLQLIRELHIRTYDYLGEFHASVNPLAYCEGGFYGGNLQPGDKIKPLLKAATASYGITALNELNRLYNGKSIAEDGEFPLEVMEYINKKLSEFKEEDGILYAVYGTPAESLCGTQVEQFRKMYGIVENVSDKGYVSNSFHCHVSENITGEEKQDLEYRFWNLFAGGRIGYVKYPIDYNIDAFKSYIRRAMEKGIYEGVNLDLGFCDDCGNKFSTGEETCPKCGSKNLTKINRMNGYLSYSRVKGDTRLNDAKMEEIKDRKSM